MHEGALFVRLLRILQPDRKAARDGDSRGRDRILRASLSGSAATPPCIAQIKTSFLQSH